VFGEKVPLPPSVILCPKHPCPNTHIMVIYTEVMYLRVKKAPIIIAGFLLIAPVFVSAQTAAELDTVLGTQNLTCAQAAGFVLAATADTSVKNTSKDAFEQAVAKGWLPQGTKPDENITLERLSFLIMKAFNIKGGIMYTFFPGPRYAFRAMVSRSYIQGAADPDMKVSGDRFLRILGKVLSATGG